MKIDKAENVKVGEVIVIPYSKWGDSGILCIGKVKEISNPHPSLLELKVDLISHVDGLVGERSCGVAPFRKVAIL